MQASGFPRRVVITGLGLICGVGNSAPEVWQNLLAGNITPAQYSTNMKQEYLRLRSSQ